MDNKPTIKELLEIEINIQQKGYKENAKKLISDFNAEKGNADGYSGRELFELLQNAVDAIDDSANSTVLISLQDDVLRICNNGEPFSITGFYSLMNSNLSPKKNENESIGDKGLGFRSILNLSETVRIYSGDVAVEFSKEIATEEFEKLKRSEEVQNVLNLYSNHEITRLAILAIPRIIKPSNDREYVTTIEMTLKEDVVGRIIERLNHFESQNLLFLEKLGEFKIIYDGSERLFRRKELNKENEITKIELSEENNNSLIRSDCWSIVSEEGVLPVKEDEEEKKEQNKIMIAYIPDQKKIPNNKLYSFFKTDVDFPFPVLVHGPFDLTPDRNHLVKNKDNANLLRKICNKIVDLALSIAEDRVDYTALELLTPSNIGNFSGLNDLPDYNFGNEYYDLVASKKVFPTVNGTYISFDDQPKFYGKYDKGKEIVNFLNGDGFYSLMPLSDKWETYSFIEKIAQKKNVRLKYTADEMVEGINTMLETISIEARAELWLKYIKYSNEQPSTHPKFVINDDKNTIACNIQVFLPPESNDFPTPPEFAEIFFLNKELVKNLQNQLSREFSRRELSDVLHQYNVKKYNLQNIVNTISEKLNAIQINDNELAIACYEQTLDWLFALWQNGIINKKNINLSKLALLNRTGNFMPAKELYFGKEFGNDITEELLSGDDELFLKPPKNSLDSNEVEEYINLMKKIGVKWYPREEPQPLNRDIFDSGYNEAVYTTLEYPYLIKGKIYLYKDIDEMRRETRFGYESYGSVRTIFQIEQILKSASTKCILSWIREDKKFNKLLSEHEQEHEVKPSILTLIGKNTSKNEIPSEDLASYVRYKFATSKWVELDGTRYSPKQCLFISRVEGKFDSLIISPDLSCFVEKNDDKNKEISIIRDLLIKIGSPTSFSELETNILYSWLLELPDVDTQGEYTKGEYAKLAYSAIASKGVKNFNKYSGAFRRFRQESGKVFCVSSKSFIPINNDDVFYLFDQGVPEQILEPFNLIDIRKKQNKWNVDTYLGVKPFNSKGEIEGEPIAHELDFDFKTDFHDFICNAFCSRMDIQNKKEENKLKKLKVTLCKDLKVNYDGEVAIMENFSYIFGEDGTEVFLKTPADVKKLGQLKSKLGFSNAVAEIYSTICETQNQADIQAMQSLYEKEPEKRENYTEFTYKDKSRLKRAREIFSDANSDKEKFVKTCELIGGEDLSDDVKSEIEAINYSELSSISNLPHIICILKTIDTDVSIFNSKTGFGINLKPYYEQEIKRLIEEHRDSYKNGLYHKLMQSSLIEKQSFTKRLNEYDEWIPEIENSVKFNYSEVFYLQFGEIINHRHGVSADEAWKENHKVFKDGKDEDLLNIFLDKAEINDLLYFGCIDDMNDKYEKFQKDLEMPLDSQKRNWDGNQESIPYTRPSKTDGVDSTGGISKINRVPRDTHRSDNNVNDGGLAEHIVYEKLKEKYKEVKWVSQKAKDSGVNPEGSDGCGYDISYKDLNGEEKYVEVKSTFGRVSPKVQFKLTSGEYEFLKQHSKQYQLFFVNLFDVDNPSNNLVRRLLIDITVEGELVPSQYNFSYTIEKEEEFEEIS